MKAIIGQRIKDERKGRNLKQEDLIKLTKLDWDRRILGSVENGERDLKAWELSRIASALNIEITHLMPAVESQTKAPVVLWRKRPHSCGSLESSFVRMCRDYELVSKLNNVDLSRLELLPAEEIDLEQFSYHQAYLLAENVRRKLGLGEYPAAYLVETLEEKYGIKFFFDNLEGSGSAACSVADYGKCILISSSEAPWRQHFSIAHELFHIITWSEVLLGQVNQNESLWEKNEKLANAFAAGLLVPSEILKAKVSTMRKDGKLSHANIVALARQFQVSLEAIIWRMVNVKLLTRDTAKNVLSNPKLKSLSLESKQDHEYPTYLSSRFVLLAFMAYKSGEISKGRLAKMLRSTKSDLESYLKKFGLAEVDNNEFPISNP